MTAYITWGLSLLFYLLQFTLRIAPNVMSKEIIHTYSIGAEQFASLGSLFFFSYGLLQIPVGIAIDKSGTKIVMLCSIFLCIISSTMASMVSHFKLLQLARVISGIGSAPALLCCLKIVTDYFPQRKHPVMMGMTLAIGSLSSFIMGGLLSHITETIHLSSAYRIIAATATLIFIAILCCVKQTKNPEIINEINESETQGKTSQQKLSSTKPHETITDILFNKKIIILAFFSVLLYSPLALLADLWGGPFIVAKFAIKHSIASKISLYLYVGLAIGSMTLPWLWSKLNQLENGIMISSSIVITLFAMLIIRNNITEGMLITVMFIIGLSCSAEMICFALATRSFGREHSGWITGIINTVNILSVACFQQTVGLVLGMVGSGQINAYGIPIYTANNYNIAMGTPVLIMSIILITCLVNRRKIQ